MAWFNRNVFGTFYSDTLNGNNNSNFIYGFSGDDTIRAATFSMAVAGMILSMVTKAVTISMVVVVMTFCRGVLEGTGLSVI